MISSIVSFALAIAVAYYAYNLSKQHNHKTHN
jgi:hypothetical protein